MKPYFVKTPNFIKLFFKNWVWNFYEKEKVIYLTFDDGPTPKITEWTLNELNKYHAKATFFCIGKNVAEHPNIYHKIIENNHAIGNHTHNHFNGLKTETITYLNNIELAEKQLNSSQKTSTLGETSSLNTGLTRRENLKLFRPPYGKLSLSLAKKIRKKGYKIVMWDVLSADFDTSISEEKCLENVIKNTKNGSIVVFHDSIKASKNLQFALPKILEYYSEKGFAFKKIEN